MKSSILSLINKLIATPLVMTSILISIASAASDKTDSNNQSLMDLSIEELMNIEVTTASRQSQNFLRHRQLFLSLRRKILNVPA